ncbi:MAG: UdgX family uracil-DNA binding protein, partial [Steroidobacteraceae bacterium]
MPSRKAAVVLDQVRQAARGCTNCPLYKLGTQTVFGEGPAPAPVLMVGEQPGDREDLEGRPFVGPAGQLLDRALKEAGLDRHSIYVTNAVKHFKWEPRGKRRLHKKPIEREIAACRPWLLQELELVQPALIVCLGATAAQSLLGKSFRITQQRGVVLRHEQYGTVMATYHPSALLRMPD